MGAGLKAHNVFKKKYPLIISDERVSLSHLNLMTLSARETFFYGSFVEAGIPSYIGISNTSGWFRIPYFVYEVFVETASE